MTVESLMTQSVTLRRRLDVDDLARTPTGDVVPAFDELRTTMYLEPTGGTEAGPDRNTPIGQWLGVGRPSIDWTAWDQVAYGDLTFDIVAPVRPMTNPRTRRVSHVELSLEAVE